MNVVYTESGLSELERFQQQQKKFLEETIASRKYVFGDDVVEITRADVQEAAPSIRPLPQRTSSRYASLRWAALTYIAVGVTISISGIGLPYFRALYDRDKLSFVLSIVGLVMGTFGVLLLEVIRVRLKRAEQFDIMQQHFRQASARKIVSAKDFDVSTQTRV